MTHAVLNAGAWNAAMPPVGRLAGAALAVAALTSSWQSDAVVGAENKYWEVSSYAVHLSLVVDSAYRPGAVSAASLADAIEQRAETRIGPLWSLVLETGGAAATRRTDAPTTPLTWETLPRELRRFDKAMRLSVTATAAGFRLRCDEYDIYTRRSGPLHERTVRQPLMLAEQCFLLLRDCFSPLATVETLPNEDDRVRMRFKGAGLPQTAGDLLSAAVDRPYQPLLRRTNRSGELREGGLVDLPWTLLEIEGEADDGWIARVESGINRPFGVRRRGLVEQLAIGVSRPLERTEIRLHARADPTQALAGYEVFVRQEDDADPALLGISNSDGIVSAPARLGPVTTLYVRSEGQLLAKAPVAPGSARRIEMPIADDPARLYAEAIARSIREELVDLVAQRAILSARVKARLAEGRVDAARKIVSDLNRLPGTTEFELRIDAAERQRAATSGDPRVQRRIAELFSQTRSLLSRFLSRGRISELQSEVESTSQDKG